MPSSAYPLAETLKTVRTIVCNYLLSLNKYVLFSICCRRCHCILEEYIEKYIQEESSYYTMLQKPNYPLLPCCHQKAKTEERKSGGLVLNNYSLCRLVVFFLLSENCWVVPSGLFKSDYGLTGWLNCIQWYTDIIVNRHPVVYVYIPIYMYVHV